jgi:hypothetical protein
MPIVQARALIATAAEQLRANAAYVNELLQL